MKDDIENKMYDVRDSVRMKGIGDKLEQLISETEKSIGLQGAAHLSEDDLDMVAGGRMMSGGTDPLRFPFRTPGAPGGLNC